MERYSLRGKLPDLISSNDKFVKFRRRILAKPVTFSKSFSTFTAFAKVGAFASAVNILLFWDFGEKPHVFSRVRERFEVWQQHFFTLSPKERLEYEKSKKL
jgi:hypothetical protein